MCGISGCLVKNGIKNHIIKKTLNIMKSRGPDNRSYINIPLKNNKKLSFLHSRLNIIDLNNRANQPMKFDNNIIIFNGEIYNYIELKKGFKKRYYFKTKSDTEVLLKCYSEYGDKMNSYLEGMCHMQYLIKIKQNSYYQETALEKNLFYSKLNNNFFFIQR